MDSVRLKHLLAKYKEGNYTKADAEELLHYLHDADNRTHVAQLAAEGLFEGSEQDILSELEHERLDLLFSKISEKTDPNSFGASRLRWRARVARALIAAVFLSLLSIGYYFWRSNQVQQIIVTAGKGKVYDVKLPDGSRVWLNSGASLSYPELFKGDKRSVILTDGQAFFEVTENKDKPFLIKAGTLNVQVLGTSFEIENSPAGQTTVVLATGKVSVANESEAVTLTQAGETAFVEHESATLQKRQGNATGIAPWRHPRLDFDGQTLAEVFEILEQRYNTVFTINRTNLLDRKVTITVGGESLEQVLKPLSFTYNFNYEMPNDSTVIIK